MYTESESSMQLSKLLEENINLKHIILSLFADSTFSNILFECSLVKCASNANGTKDKKQNIS